MENLVRDTLNIDKISRTIASQDGWDNDLFFFESVQPNEWDYSLPTLASGQSNKIIASLQDFIDRFYKNIPFKINMQNILIAGGSVSSVLTKRDNFRDIDIFMYDLTEEEATKRINTLINDLSESYLRHLKEQEKERSKTNNTKQTKTRPKKITYDFKYIRNKNCVTIIFDDKYIVQIILRIYHNKSEILHGFDLGSSAVGFDGQKVYFTSLSKFAYEYSCNILDTNRRSTTYEKRLIKYFNRDFDIIVPNMDINKVRNINSKYKLSDVCEMPYTVFSYDNVKGNKIEISRFLIPAKVDDSDYQIENLDEYRIFYINLHNVVWGKDDFYFYVDKVKDVANAKPFISRRKIIDYYDGLGEKLKKNNNINIRMLKKYMKNTTEILKTLIEKGDNDSQFISLLDKGIQEEKSRVLSIVDDLLTKSYPLNWLVKNPGTQITSSFNPIIEDCQKWYGDYYIENPIIRSSIIKHSHPVNIYKDNKNIDEEDEINDETDKMEDKETTSEDESKSDNDDEEISVTFEN